MRKILTFFVLIALSLVFTACPQQLDISSVGTGKTIAVYNSSKTNAVVIPLDKDGNENVNEAVWLRSKYTVKMTFSAGNEMMIFVPNPNVSKTETGLIIISGPRWWRTDITPERCYNYAYSNNKVTVAMSAKLTEDYINSFPQGTLVKDMNLD